MFENIKTTKGWLDNGPCVNLDKVQKIEMTLQRYPWFGRRWHTQEFGRRGSFCYWIDFVTKKWILTRLWEVAKRAPQLMFGIVMNLSILVLKLFHSIKWCSFKSIVLSKHKISCCEPMPLGCWFLDFLLRCPGLDLCCWCCAMLCPRVADEDLRCPSLQCFDFWFLMILFPLDPCYQVVLFNLKGLYLGYNRAKALGLTKKG